jgi:hypothetical protein
MSLKGNLEQIEHLERFLGHKSHSRKWYKKVRNKWLRQHSIEDIPNIKLRKGWEY